MKPINIQKGYYINAEGYITAYGKAAEGAPDFVPSEKMRNRVPEGYCLKANEDRTAIEYVEIITIPAQPTLAERIAYLKAMLNETDYKSLKFAEGEMTEEEFAPIREQRAAWRAEINVLEAQIANE